MGWIAELILQVHLHFMNQNFSEAGTFFQVTKDAKMGICRVSKLWIGSKTVSLLLRRNLFHKLKVKL